jgi:transcriptional regulator with XRE-family HTH domain
MSVRRLSSLAGVSNPYLSQIERGLRKPSAEILYERAGILEGGSDLTHHIRRDPLLSDLQKDELVRLYDSFTRPEFTRPEPPPSEV